MEGKRGYVSVPRVTQDNTPPRTEFQNSSTPHQEKCRSRTGCRWQDLADSFRKRVVRFWIHAWCRVTEL